MWIKLYHFLWYCFSKLTKNDVRYRLDCYRANWQRLTQSEEQFSVECRKWPVTVFSLSVLYLTILSDSIFAIDAEPVRYKVKKRLEWSICNHYNHFERHCSRCRCCYCCLSYFFLFSSLAVNMNFRVFSITLNWK